MNDVQELEPVERQEVFHGTFEDCLDHFKQCFNAHFPKGLPGAEKGRQPIVDFCGADHSTVRHWFSRSQRLEGLAKIKLMCFLDMLGYSVIELEKLKDRRTFAELLGYRVITLQQAAERLGYAVPHHTYAFLKMKRGRTPEKEARMQEVCQELKGELAQKKEEMRQQCQLGFPLMASAEQRKASAVTSIMEGLLALLKSNELGRPFSANLEHLSPHDRGTVLELADILGDLSSMLVVRLNRKGTHNE